MTSPQLLIVADDLTGALDSAGEAARVGIATRVYLSPAALTAAKGQRLPPVVAVSTGSRDGPAAAALQAMAEICLCLGWLRPAQVMKKVDSRLKGHVAGETAALAAALGTGRILAAPALPDMGRVQRGGLLLGAGIAVPVAIAGRFGDLDVTAPDILATADMAAALDRPGLPVGARAMAAALVARLWPRAMPAPRPVLPAPAVLAIGSRDPITLRQVAHLTLPVTEAPNGVIGAGDADPQGTRLYQMVPAPGPDCPAAEAGQAFAQTLAARLAGDWPGTLIACGGETAGAILTRLGVDHLDVTGTALPGVPVAQACLPGGLRMTVLTKSGGFGGADTLAKLVKMIDKGDPDRNTNDIFNNGPFA